MFATHGDKLWIGGCPMDYLVKNFPQFAESSGNHEDKLTWVEMKKDAKDWTSTLNSFTIMSGPK